MAVDKLEIETYFGRCKCCLSYGYLRTMWEKHVVEGEPEMYGQMLTQCFSIPWTIQTREEDDQICEDCVWKLREACMFKKQVLQSQKELGQSEPGDMELEIKLEPNDEDYVVEYLEEDILDSLEFNKHFDTERDSVGSEDGADTIKKEILDETESQNDASKYEEMDCQEERPPPRKRQSRRQNSASDSDAPKPKWPRKLPIEERYRTYRQYSEEALKNAMDAVMSKRMNQKGAAKHYHVPRKTLSAKLRDVKGNKIIVPSNSRKFVKEVKTLLNHVNATPFRCRANQPVCFYCLGKPRFSSANELRQHNASEHANPTIDILEVAMRPLFSNEIIKLDLKDSACKLCNIALLNWADALQHMENVHDVHLEFKNKMVPFVLGDNHCVICSEEFSCFMLLHSHMNKHFGNYACAQCGDSFASASRLKTHQKIHSIGHFPCLTCKKVFSLEKYLKKHALIHSGEMKVKCQHCTELFKSEHQRQAHKLIAHKELMESITCELCGSTYHWMRHFLRHMKRKHGTEYHCDECGKFFQSKSILKEHRYKHLGVKQFKCMVCCRKFYSRASVRSHLKCSHLNFKS